MPSLENFVRSRLAHLRVNLNFLRSRDVKGKGAIIWAYLRLSLLARVSPHRTKPVEILGFRVAYGSMFYLKNLFRDIFIERPYVYDTDKESPIIIDAGANIGLTALYYKYNYPAARITCFEPDPQTYQLLKQNVEGNDLSDVVLYNQALSNQNGTVTFYSEQGGAGGNPGSSISPELYQESSKDWKAGESGEEGSGRTEVPARRLSEQLEGAVDLLKIDIEGSEGLVIEDLKDCLGQIAEIQMEFHYVQGINQLGKMLTMFEDAHHSYRLIPPHYQVENKNGSLAFIYTRRTAP